MVEDVTAVSAASGTAQLAGADMGAGAATDWLYCQGLCALRQDPVPDRFTREPERPKALCLLQRLQKVTRMIDPSSQFTSTATSHALYSTYSLPGSPNPGGLPYKLFATV